MFPLPESVPIATVSIQGVSPLNRSLKCEFKFVFVAQRLGVPANRAELVFAQTMKPLLTESALTDKITEDGYQNRVSIVEPAVDLSMSLKERRLTKER